ncbi:hypothetical protein F4604DRAFT_1991823 [Suillus subluteus]|nr:hypothetical protein F4604DRAFT_1991823 [Suillus subluteus]
MAENLVDLLQTLSATLAVPADSKEQADILATLRESLEAHPNSIPILCTTLIKTVSSASDSLLKRWVLDLLHFAISPSNLSNEVCTQFASQSVDMLAILLHDLNVCTMKVSIQRLTTVYPLLFCSLCTNHTLCQQWDVLSQWKVHILEFIWSPTASTSVKVSAIKFMQCVIIVQMRGISDPRLQNKNDPNISNVHVDHPFLPGPTLEVEGMKLLESVITMLYTSQNPELLSAILHSWSNLVKQRPALIQLVVSSLSSWTPATLSRLPASSVKNVKKALGVLKLSIEDPMALPLELRSTRCSPYKLLTWKEPPQRKRHKRLPLLWLQQKLFSTPVEHPSDAKCMTIDVDIAGNTSVAFLAHSDFTMLPISLITNLIVANLQAFTEPALLELVQAYRQRRGLAPGPPVSRTPWPTQPTPEATPTPGPSVEPTMKDEPVDPL